LFSRPFDRGVNACPSTSEALISSSPYPSRDELIHLAYMKQEDMLIPNAENELFCV